MIIFFFSIQQFQERRGKCGPYTAIVLYCIPNSQGLLTVTYCTLPYVMTCDKQIPACFCSTTSDKMAGLSVSKAAVGIRNESHCNAAVMFLSTNSRHLLSSFQNHCSLNPAHLSTMHEFYEALN